MSDKAEACPYDPTKLKGLPIGMFHCPVCGEMVIAGLPHPPQDEETMSDKAEAAFRDWFKNPRRFDSMANLLEPITYSHAGFLAGYAAASADCEAQVRAAVEAMIEEAAKESCGMCFNGIPLRGLPYKNQSFRPIRVHLLPTGSNVRCEADTIRAIDPEPIVRRVMHKEG